MALVLFYVPTNSAQGIQFLHILTNTCFLFVCFCKTIVFPMDMRLYLTVALHFSDDQ